MLITYPVWTVVDDSGNPVAGATVTVASVKDKAGADVAGPGLAVNVSGANVSVDYDAAAHGEAWVVLSVSKPGSAFTGLNAAPASYLSTDPGTLAVLTATLQLFGDLLIPAAVVSAADLTHARVAFASAPAPDPAVLAGRLCKFQTAPRAPQEAVIDHASAVPGQPLQADLVFVTPGCVLPPVAGDALVVA